MIDISKMSAEDLKDLSKQIEKEFEIIRHDNAQKEAWAKVIEAVTEYEKIIYGDSIIGDSCEDSYSIEFCADSPGRCYLYSLGGGY